jgi:hypothetical protein
MQQRSVLPSVAPLVTVVPLTESMMVLFMLTFLRPALMSLAAAEPGFPVPDKRLQEKLFGMMGLTAVQAAELVRCLVCRLGNLLPMYRLPQIQEANKAAVFQTLPGMPILLPVIKFLLTGKEPFLEEQAQ